jgi:hypothetical protein
VISDLLCMGWLKMPSGFYDTPPQNEMFCVALCLRRS